MDLVSFPDYDTYLELRISEGSWLRRFTAWLGNNSSQGKQRRLLGELHTRLSASGACTADRTGLRTTYLPTFRLALTKPLVELEKEGIEPVVSLMQVVPRTCSALLQSSYLNKNVPCP